jgi:ATP-dependent DNA ligase
MLESVCQLPPGTAIDGEVVAVGERDGRPVQDFATVQRAVLRGDADAAARLRFVAFDLLRVAGEDVRARPWRERDQQLRSLVECDGSVRLIDSQPATEDAHAAIVALGFEGTVLKRPGSTYRAGRQRAWLKHKARHVAHGVLLEVREDREKRYWAICDVDSKRVAVAASTGTRNTEGRAVTIVYSRIDADGGLREARLADGPPRPV